MSDALGVALAYLDALGGTEPDAVADLVSDDFRNEHHAEFGSGCVGQDEYRRRLPGFFASFPNRTYTVVETAIGRLVDTVDEPASDTASDPEHDTTSGVTEVVVRYRFGADVGEHRIDIPGVMWISVRDDRVIRRLDTWDSLTFLRQTDQDPTV